MLTIPKCKDILGEMTKTMTDSDIENLKDIFVVLSDFAIDSFLDKRKVLFKTNEYENKEN
jgi:hypothetical protein